MKLIPTKHQILTEAAIENVFPIESSHSMNEKIYDWPLLRHRASNLKFERLIGTKTTSSISSKTNILW